MRIVLFVIAVAAYTLACWKGDVNTATLAWWAGMLWGYLCTTVVRSDKP